jgi:hypothetical protein
LKKKGRKMFAGIITFKTFSWISISGETKLKYTSCNRVSVTPIFRERQKATYIASVKTDGQNY